MKEVFYNLFMIWKHLRLYNTSTASLFVGPTPYKRRGNTTCRTVKVLWNIHLVHYKCKTQVEFYMKWLTIKITLEKKMNKYMIYRLIMINFAFHTQEWTLNLLNYFAVWCKAPAYVPTTGKCPEPRSQCCGRLSVWRWEGK